MKKLTSILICLQLLLLTPAMAQSDDLVKNTQTDILLVASAGAAGALLGLSTLSFVDRPSRHLRNIWTGAALGVIVGVVFVAYNSAQRGSEDLQSSREFSTHDRIAWHIDQTPDLTFSQVQFGTQLWHLNF